ncbi:MAG TPA: dihydrofolate reductase [Anaerolineales bacterium]|nr:dihydrofolate reductase [Anaerolineales bacterium]
MIISLIVAMDERGGIGLNNQVPWHLPSDLKRFKSLTMGHYLIVGRKTYESIGRLLPGRMMIIVTRANQYQAAGCLVAASLKEALSIAAQAGENEVFIGGGGQIFAQAIAIADRIYLTQVHTTAEADVYFPAWDRANWQVVQQLEQAQAENEAIAYSFIVLERLNR